GAAFGLRRPCHRAPARTEQQIHVARVSRSARARHDIGSTWHLGMILYVIARPNGIAAREVDSSALFLPASIPAAMALRERGIRALYLSDMLAPEDFHAVWRTVITAVWRAVSQSAEEVSELPKVLPIFAYSLAVAMAQALVIGRWLDRARERFDIT